MSCTLFLFHLKYQLLGLQIRIHVFEICKSKLFANISANIRSSNIREYSYQPYIKGVKFVHAVIKILRFREISCSLNFAKFKNSLTQNSKISRIAFSLNFSRWGVLLTRLLNEIQCATLELIWDPGCDNFSKLSILPDNSNAKISSFGNLEFNQFPTLCF